MTVLNTAELAMADQLTAQANDELDQMIPYIREGDAQNGEPDNLANMLLDMETAGFAPEHVHALLIVAIWRLGKAEKGTG
jgi:hypothetical protein